jgi:hypothetical protein
MLEFATLFVSLVIGIHPVEVVVTEPVASVGFFLDGQSIGVVTEPPWKIACNFGRVPLPHELLAVARDKTDREVSTARQLINLPRSSSELKIVLTGSTNGSPSRARLIIGKPLFVEMEHLVVEFDGIPLSLNKDLSLSFPEFDTSIAHVLAAEVGFSDGSAAHSAVSFSLGASGIAETQLTAVPIVVSSGVEPTLESLQDTFRVNDLNVSTKAIARPGGHVIMVRDISATEDLRRLGEFRDRRVQPTRRSEIWNEALAGGGRDLEQAMFRIAEPIPTMLEASGKSLARTFWVSPPFRIEDAGLDWCATHVFPRPRDLTGGHQDQQVTDAVAIAGLHAAGSGRPRTVVVVVGDKDADTSLFGTEATKQFLRAINVPLVVWSTNPSAAQRWQGAVEVRNPKQLSSAADAVMATVESQWIVWVEGLHMPSDITVSEVRKDIRIADMG